MTPGRGRSQPQLRSHVERRKGLNFQLLPETAPYRELSEFYDDFYEDEAYLQGAGTIIRETSRHIGPGRHSLLDVGAGTGRMARFLSARFNVVALEPELPMLRQLSYWSPDAMAVNKHIEDLPSSETYDVVTALGGVVAHMKTAGQLRMWCNAVISHVKKGGIAFIDPWHTPATARAIAGKPVAKPGWGPRFTSHQTRVGCRFNVLSVHRNRTFTRYYYIIQDVASRRVRCYTHIAKLMVFKPDVILNALSAAGCDEVGPVRTVPSQTCPPGFRVLYFARRNAT